MSHSHSGNSTGDPLDDITKDCTGSPDDGQNDNDDLAVDVDLLENDDCNCDKMLDVLMKDPEWTNIFKPIHVTQFRGLSGPNFDLSSDPVNYFKLFFTDDVISTIYVKTQTSTRNSNVNKKELLTLIIR